MPDLFVFDCEGQLNPLKRFEGLTAIPELV